MIGSTQYQASSTVTEMIVTIIKFYLPPEYRKIKEIHSFFFNTILQVHADSGHEIQRNWGRVLRITHRADTPHQQIHYPRRREKHTHTHHQQAWMQNTQKSYTPELLEASINDTGLHYQGISLTKKQCISTDSFIKFSQEINFGCDYIENESCNRVYLNICAVLSNVHVIRVNHLLNILKLDVVA